MSLLDGIVYAGFAAALRFTLPEAHNEFTLPPTSREGTPEQLPLGMSA